MANPTKFYLSEIYKKAAGYRPTWEPNKPLKVGDIGILKDDVFVLVGSLQKLGVDVEVRIDEQVGEVFDLSSESGVDVKIKAAGEVDPMLPSLGKMDLGFSVNFKKENSILFKVNGYKTHLLENLILISREIKKMYKNDEWEQNWVIINEVVEANRATIMMSSEGNVSVGVKAKADVGPEQLDLAQADLELDADSGGKLAISILGNEGITPLYRVVGIKKSFFGKVKIENRNSDVGVSAPQEFEEDIFQEIEMDVE